MKLLSHCAWITLDIPSSRHIWRPVGSLRSWALLETGLLLFTMCTQADWSENFQGFVSQFPILPKSMGYRHMLLCWLYKGSGFKLRFLCFYDNILTALLPLSPVSFFNLFPCLS